MQHLPKRFKRQHWSRTRQSGRPFVERSTPLGCPRSLLGRNPSAKSPWLERIHGNTNAGRSPRTGALWPALIQVMLHTDQHIWTNLCQERASFGHNYLWTKSAHSAVNRGELWDTASKPSREQAVPRHTDQERSRWRPRERASSGRASSASSHST
jgi:hypothetical protein